MSGNRRRGGLVGMITAGVGVAAEYREHRKEQKQRQLSRGNSGQDVQASQAEPSTSPQPQNIGSSSRSLDAPPLYADLPEGSNGNRLLAPGGLANDDKKTAHAQYQDDDDDDDESDDSRSTEDDEEDWQLDEVLPSYQESIPDHRSADELARVVMLTSRAASDVPRMRHAIPLPVIIPQRRPRNKTRGFVRAYAPVLADSGIDQATFLSFLDNFHKSSQASPVFTVILISATIAGFAPSLIATAVTTAVQVAARVGAEVQGRQRTNHFLDKMNDELFKPNGLYAFVMKYKTDEDLNNQTNPFGIRGEKIDMSTNQIVAKYAPATLSSRDSNTHSMTDRMRDLRVASGNTQGSFHLPSAAPLIFPDIDNAIARYGAEETLKDKARDAQLFLADYLDRRAQAKYALDDPRSNLAVPTEQRSFRSKLADPNHPMYQGQSGLVGLATGGGLGGRRAERRYQRDERRVKGYEGRMDHGRGLSRRKQERYEHFLAEEERVSSGHSDGRMRGSDGFGRLGGGRRRGGGLIGGLIGAAVNAAQDRVGSVSSTGARELPLGRSGEYEDTYDGRHMQEEQYYDNSLRRVSYDGREEAATGVGAGGYQKFSRHGQRGGGRRPGAVGAVRRLMREDVLYLMVVNMPSEAEMAEARRESGSV
ncbi:hypothetical protein LTR91_009677 [Friedmanniomyces endolithicus]|uniref:Uncharacterized protein n=1 Tax=Friedmanniomyces endolithicus TaxID=329885 RepID=A0AAN6J4V9_9PEZI|nr:hypothetical protein LTR82_012814 [Friedmanniomyces endolithicus]KAK0928207.1 hypothetical protein LTR57_002941 [Friedmanniomyces endolithicus]KAK0983672.1 hypothetical protein LTS01_010939 [Friedmanniomyces endolithicus]KAK0988122.1 hypothetical protein LTR91_009677 [Friedmanniomyces endolithicus]KAK1052915.1 hypothetical protein LTS16_001338 [Friedmanniomyces endolithicus]